MKEGLHSKDRGLREFDSNPRTTELFVDKKLLSSKYELVQLPQTAAGLHADKHGIYVVTHSSPEVSLQTSRSYRVY
jgi:hypothetical protein